MNSSIINFLYSTTYGIVIFGAIMTGMAAGSEDIPLFMRFIFLIIGFSALVQIILDIQGYRVSKTV